MAVTSAWARFWAPELLVDPGDVRLHRRLAHVELLADRGGVRAVGQEQEHVVLAGGQPGRLRAHPAHHGAGQAGAEERPRGHAACRAARTTSVDGASLPTKAEAPASIAAKIWSSPECMVTRPGRSSRRFWRTWRMMSRPVPSCSWRSVTITSGAVFGVRRDGLGDGADRAGHLGTVLAGEGADEPFADQLVVVDDQDTKRTCLGGHAGIPRRSRIMRAGCRSREISRCDTPEWSSRTATTVPWGALSETVSSPPPARHAHA